MINKLFQKSIVVSTIFLCIMFSVCFPQEGGSAADDIAMGNRAFDEWKNEDALEHYLAAIEIEPNNYEALWKTSRTYIDIGELVSKEEEGWEEKCKELYQKAEEYARRAVKANPKGSWGHHYVSASMGLRALLLGKKQQIDMSKEIKKEIEKAIELDPNNDFALHAYGRWHRRIAEIGGGQRFAARIFLFRSVPKGSFEESVEYFKKAIALNPEHINHHYELGITYKTMKEWELARTELQKVLELPVTDQDDPLHKKDAEKFLEEIKEEN